MDHLFSPNAKARLSGHRDNPAPGRLLARLATGLVQGLLLYALYHQTRFDKLDSGFLAAWGLVAAYAPLVWLAAIGQIGRGPAIVWSLAATVLIAALGLASGFLVGEPFGQSVVFVCLPFALFCAHHLVIPALHHGSLRAPYDAYYETAWKAGIQLVLSLMFLGTFWLVLFVGANLFNAIGIDLVENLIESKPFIFIASALVFALGVELTDVREGLTQGIRTVALTLLSWLLPLAVLLAAAFLIALPLAGVGALRASLSPAGLMLAAAAGIIVLVNTVYQDGAEHLSSSRFLRIVTRIACVLLLPLTAFALWGVAVRIGQYGLTVERVVAITAAVVGLVYAAGYTAAQFLPRGQSGWLPFFERTNVAAAVLTVIILLAFSTPLLNPMQMSLRSQIARIDSGRLDATSLPYQWLALNGGPRGKEVLERLAASDDREVARRARLALDNPYGPVERDPARITFLPEGTVAPEGFEGARFCFQAECKARLMDVDQDGEAEILLRNVTTFTVLKRDTAGEWQVAGAYNQRTACGGSVDGAAPFDTRAPETLPPSGPAPLGLDGTVFDFVPAANCVVKEN